MIKKPPHNRKLGIVGIALTKAMNNPREIEALTLVRDEVEKVITESGYLEGAPFSWVTLAIRYGLKNEPEPTYQKINQRYGDLPLAIARFSLAAVEKRFQMGCITLLDRRRSKIRQAHARA